MIIPRHKICDICNRELGVNTPYTTIKRTAIWAASGGSCKEQKKVHICCRCWDRITSEIAQEKWYKGKADVNN